VGGLSVLCKGEATQKLQMLFMLLDADNSGHVSKAELQTFFMTMYAVSKGIKDGCVLLDEEVLQLEQATSKEIDSIIASAGWPPQPATRSCCAHRSPARHLTDSNDDGQLSWDEFYACVVRENSKLRQLTELFDAVATDAHVDAEAVTEADCKQS
jgi:hypothetical protein